MLSCSSSPPVKQIQRPAQQRQTQQQGQLVPDDRGIVYPVKARQLIHRGEQQRITPDIYQPFRICLVGKLRRVHDVVLFDLLPEAVVGNRDPLADIRSGIVSPNRESSGQGAAHKEKHKNGDKDRNDPISPRVTKRLSAPPCLRTDAGPVLFIHVRNVLPRVDGAFCVLIHCEPPPPAAGERFPSVRSSRSRICGQRIEAPPGTGCHVWIRHRLL